MGMKREGGQTTRRWSKLFSPWQKWGRICNEIATICLESSKFLLGAQCIFVLNNRIKSSGGIGMEKVPLEFNYSVAARLCQRPWRSFRELFHGTCCVRPPIIGNYLAVFHFHGN
jgi:hypothetical protein